MLVVLVILVASHIFGLRVLGGLLGDPKHEIEHVEQEADDAGQKAAEEKRDELDAETDEQVVDDSGAADTVRDDERALSTDANADERDAESDLDRRLRGDGDG